MGENRYKIIMDNCITVAENMNIETATFLIKALFERNYNDHCMTLIIKEMDRVDEENSRYDR